MKTLWILALLPQTDQPDFNLASKTILEKLEASIDELSALREEIAQNQIPLSRELGQLETQLSEVRTEYQATARKLDQRTFDLQGLTSERQAFADTSTYLSNLLGEYGRNFASRLHIAEVQRYGEQLDAAALAPENSNLGPAEIFTIQADLLELSIARLEQALGGDRFQGTAVDPEGVVREGSFLMFGPAALFASKEGEAVGTAEERLGSQEPTMLGFQDPATNALALELARTGKGSFPLDPTLGNAHKIEATQDTFVEHVRKGGPVMIPIFAMAGLALALALFKWLHLSFTATPSKKKIGKLLEAVADHDEEAARELTSKMRGPAGEMLHAGVAHMKEPRDLIEEIMYEKVMTTKLRLQRYLPFLAICAASAPLLGLLGTVTGIINTFKLITVFGSGDVKMLSGGISEALITTKFGLIVAIPALLLHAFLARKARGITGQMEAAAVAFVNQVSKAPFELTYGIDHAPRNGVAVKPVTPESSENERVRVQIQEVLSEMLVPHMSDRMTKGTSQ